MCWSAGPESAAMYTEQDYNRDLNLIKKVDTMISDKWEIVAYFVGMTACLAAHVLYLILFAANGINVMAVFNIFSVLFYVLMILLVLRVKNRVNLIYASIFEIVVHAGVATMCVGWKPDFDMFLLMIIPIAFLMPNENKKIPYTIMLISLTIYGVQRFIYQGPENTIYNIEQEPIARILFIIKLISGVFVLIYVTTIYTVLNQYTEATLRVQTEKLRIAASVDPLTKLFNRRAMNEDLKKNTTESEATGLPYVIGIGDIDDFKHVNDTFGHDFGDIVLSRVAELMKENFPGKCRIARWGGEEFLVLIPAVTMEEGLPDFEKVVQTIRDHTFVFGGSVLHVTMTFGVCEASSGADVDKVISRADKRLYKGKNNGKNHVEYTD